MIPGYYNQYPPQEAQFNSSDEFSGKNRFYQIHAGQETKVSHMRAISPVQNQPQKYEIYTMEPPISHHSAPLNSQQQKMNITDQRLGNDLDYYKNQRAKFPFHSSNNIYQEREHTQADPQKYVSIHVHESMIRHYQSALSMIKNQNNILIKKLKNRMEKMDKLYQFTSKTLAFSSNQQKNSHNPISESEQQNLISPVNVLQNKIRSLKEKKAMQQKIKIQTVEKNSSQQDQNSRSSQNQQKNEHHSDEFNGQESFLVDQTVKKAENLKKMNPNDPKANTFGIRRCIENFSDKYLGSQTQQETQNEETKCLHNFIVEFLDNYFCDKITYTSQRQFNNSKLSKNQLLRIFLQWRLKNKGSLNSNIEKKIIQDQIIEELRKRFVRCKVDNTFVIGIGFKDSTISGICI